MEFDTRYDEQTWRNEADYRERSEARYEAMEQDFTFDRIAVAKCDGSGIVEEHYFDADQTEALACPGCYACALRESQQEAEMVEFRGRRYMRGANGKAEELDAFLTEALEDDLEQARRRGAIRKPALPELMPGFKFIAMDKDAA